MFGEVRRRPPYGNYRFLPAFFHVPFDLGENDFVPAVRVLLLRGRLLVHGALVEFKESLF
jgi:hypothetical protein